MGYLTFQTILTGSEPELYTGIQQLHVTNDMLIAVSDQNGGLLRLDLLEGQNASEKDFKYHDAQETSGLLNFATMSDNDQIWIAAQSGKLVGYDISTADFEFSKTYITLPSINDQSIQSTTFTSNSANDFVVFAYDESIEISEIGNADNRAVLTVPVEATQLLCVENNGKSYAIVVSKDSQITSYLIEHDQTALSFVSQTGPKSGLGLNEVTDIKLTTINEKTFLIVSSSLSNSISVLQFSDGELTPTDHIIDTRSTRFGGAQSVEVIQIGEHTFILSGGNDDGLSLFFVSASGQLIYLESVTFNGENGLRNITDIAAISLGNEIQIFVSSQEVQGIAQFSIDVSDIGTWNVGTSNANTLVGTDQDDTIDGGFGSDTLNGSDGNDLLIDGRGHDTLSGGAGADVFHFVNDGQPDTILDFDPAEDKIDLSGYTQFYGLDQLTFVSTNTGATIRFRDELITIHSHDGRSLNLVDVFGHSYSGPSRPPLMLSNHFFGSVADNVMSGSDNADLIQGFEGDDQINGLDGDDTIEGGEGNDSLFGGNGADQIFGSLGADTIAGANGDDTLEGGEGNDTITGGDGRDLIIAGDGDDDVRMGSDDDIFIDSNPNKPSGHDIVYAGSGNDQINGIDGKNEFHGEDGADQIYGGSDDDVIYGGLDYDIINAGPGNDQVWGGNGNDQINLGSGNDIFYDNAQNDENGNDIVFGGLGDDIFHGDGGRDIFHGESGRDIISGGIGDDILFGGADPDIIHAGDGNDVVRGGAGRDTVYLNQGDDIFHDDQQDDSNGGDLVFGGYGNDIIYGAGGDDILHGEHGNDEIHGGLSNDHIFGGTGDDLIYGGDGNDTVFGGAGADHIFLNTGNDIYFGHAQQGTSGSDRVYGGHGNDTINGSAGHNFFFGQWGDDQISGGTETDQIYGGDGNDTLYGNNGDDQLFGGNENDVLCGGDGNDTLFGGDGDDHFVFKPNFGTDSIFDFEIQSELLIFDIDRINSVNDLEIQQIGTNLSITAGTDTVFLVGISEDELSNSNFSFI